MTPHRAAAARPDAPALAQVPGHELVGTVTAVGASVTAFKPGDKVGVGCLGGSCSSCKQCAKGKQQYCKGLVFTYNSKLPDGRLTFGGYSTDSAPPPALRPPPLQRL